MLAEALDGASGQNGRALEEVLRRDPEGRLARLHRVSPALALRASRLGLEGGAADVWRRRLHGVAAQRLHLEASLDRLGRRLGEIPWVPIKGMDLGDRVYDVPEERPTSDLDVLIAAERFAEARDRLAAAGWQVLHDGLRGERYLREEGYAWQARDPDGGALLELHFRLWGLVDPAFAPAVLAESLEDRTLPGSGRRPRLDHAFLIAAVHLWLDAPPRRVGAFRDLERIGAKGPPGLASAIVGEAERFDLQLPVLLGAEVAYELWSERTCGDVVDGLRPRLRRSELRFLDGLEDPATAGLGGLVLARHLARRRCRHGLPRAVLRRLWPHPGIVENAADPRWPWPARRLWYQLLTAGRRNAADAVARLANRRADRRSHPARNRP